MDNGFDITRTVDFYPSGPTAPEDGVSCLEIKGTGFTREIYRPLQGHEDITRQTNFNRDGDLLYEVKQTLPHNAMESEETLLQAIIERAPTKRANMAESYGHLMMTWENLAREIVRRVSRNGFGKPWVIRAEERFATLRTRAGTNRWIVRDCAAVPTVPEMLCPVCKMDVTDTPAEELTGFHICKHVYHKTCIYQFLGYGNTVFCPACSRPIC
ncbi:hypothetical protein HA466_0218570 [Hirschfeldia incana]|nr:hypothetical protein HA466_0218510 [Hirschfeldia incana]KAJ0241466.1 hypothetical protein HA466_0218570 [Hirschfeldia incana]